MRAITLATAISTLLTMPVISQAETSEWRLADKTQSTSFTVPGQQTPQHEFGILKYNHVCSKDELYLTWTSNSPAVWSLAGKKVNIQGSFDGTLVEMPLEVVAIRELGGNAHQLTFAHVKASPSVLELIGNSQHAYVAMPRNQPELAGIFSQTKDRFALQGFNTAREQAKQRCDQQTNSAMSLAAN